ncbi:MAG: acyltransferase family protein [Bacilli bacterium]
MDYKYNVRTKNLESETIDCLRFPLMVGVLFIHNYSSIEFLGLENSVSSLPIYNVFSQLFSQVLGRVAVPLFFFISGFLFFKCKDFTISVYASKLKRRVRTLLIPYLFWNVSFLFFYYLLARVSFFSNYIIGNEYNIKYILTSLWGIVDEDGTASYPIAYQFWFIRDLMVVVLISPLLYITIRKIGILLILIEGILWYSGYSIPVIGIYGLSTSSLFFFSIGAWFSINHKDFLPLFREVQFLLFVFYPLIVFWDLYTKSTDFNFIIHKTGILVGIAFCFCLISRLIENKMIYSSVFLSTFSFFLYAVHDPWLLSQVRKVMFKVVELRTDLILTVSYFLSVIITVFLALILYCFLKKYMYSFLLIITGRY